MRLEKSESGNNTFDLVMSSVEWEEIHALAKFAQAGISHDAQAAYVAQVFTYPMSQPQDILGNQNTQAAFAAVDQLARVTPAGNGNNNVILNLPKEQMRQLLVMLGKASESEDQAELVNAAEPEKFPHRFPEIEVSPAHYTAAFDNLLAALDEDRVLNIDRPGYQGLRNG